MDRCGLCELLEKEERIIAKGECFTAVLDEFPVSRGHTLIISRTHHNRTLASLTHEETSDFLHILKESIASLNRTYAPQGYNIGQNIGKAAGQSVEHFHFHVISRYDGDVKSPLGGIRNILPDKGDYRGL